MPWDRIAQVFSFGSQWGSDAVRLVEGNDALAMLKRVEDILQDSMRVLESHERLMSEGEFNMFSIMHRNLVLKVVEVKHETQEQRSRSLFSASPADRQSFRIDHEAVHLFKQAQIYQRDVLTASRRAQLAEEENFLKQHELASEANSSQTQEPTDPTTTWYSVISSTPRTDSTLSEEPDSDVATLAHVRPKKLESADKESTDGESYRQILILEMKDRTMIMLKNSLLELSRAGEALLRATNPESTPVTRWPIAQSNMSSSVLSSLEICGSTRNNVLIPEIYVGAHTKIFIHQSGDVGAT
ncbi:hypothetical protein B0J17DRAFT_631953 [Rhizoctonia solani]|nr:hypothetical protein B0J17DRAFT_631953 [Rhizoctonia solani]